MDNKIFEWAGVITAILYSLFAAMNIGIEFFGFCFPAAFGKCLEHSQVKSHLVGFCFLRR